MYQKTTISFTQLISEKLTNQFQSASEIRIKLEFILSPDRISNTLKRLEKQGIAQKEKDYQQGEFHGWDEPQRWKLKEDRNEII